MTIYDIAREAGVAASTVSRVLNDKPGIKAETREHVRQIMKKYNFTPDQAARGLVMQSSKIIGILMQDIRIVHHIDSAYIIEQEMTRRGYCCITMSTGNTEEKMAKYIQILEERRVEGAILIGSMFGTEQVKKSIQEHLGNIPVVIVNGHLDLPNVYGVIADEERGVGQCVDLLFSKGKRKLAFSMDLDSPSNRLKQRGFVTAMMYGGWKKEDIWLYESHENSMEAGYESACRILRDHPDVEGIVYSVDLTAVGGIRALIDMGKKVPEEVAVTGVDNTVYGEISRPKLTTLDNRLVELSSMAAEILWAAMHGEERTNKIMILTSVVEREST